MDSAIASGIERYQAAAQAAQEQDMAKFVGSLAHELRNELWSARMAFRNLKQVFTLFLPASARASAQAD